MDPKLQLENIQLTLSNQRCIVCDKTLDIRLCDITNTCPKHSCKMYPGCLKSEYHHGDHSVLSSESVSVSPRTFDWYIDNKWDIVRRDVDHDVHSVWFFNGEMEVKMMTSSASDISHVNRILASGTINKHDEWTSTQFVEDGWFFNVIDEDFGKWTKSGMKPQIRQTEEAIDALASK